MASVVWDYAGGGFQDYKEDPEKGSVSYSVGAYVKDLAPATTAAMVDEALSLMPSTYNPGPISNTYVWTRDPKLVLPYDCEVRLNYRGALPVPVKIETGGTAEQQESEFDAANRALPLNLRRPLAVLWNPRSPGAPGADQATLADAQGARCPFWANKSTRTYTVRLLYDPTPLNDAFTGRTNSATWKGYAAGVALCMGIRGKSDDGGFSYLTDFSFAFDPADKWMVAARWVEPHSGRPPKLTPGQVAGQNGIIFPVMQFSADFSSLPV